MDQVNQKLSPEAAFVFRQLVAELRKLSMDTPWVSFEISQSKMLEALVWTWRWSVKNVPGFTHAFREGFTPQTQSRGRKEMSLSMRVQQILETRIRVEEKLPFDQYLSRDEIRAWCRKRPELVDKIIEQHSLQARLTLKEVYEMKKLAAQNYTIHDNPGAVNVNPSTGRDT